MGDAGILLGIWLPPGCSYQITLLPPQQEEVVEPYHSAMAVYGCSAMCSIGHHSKGDSIYIVGLD